LFLCLLFLLIRCCLFALDDGVSLLLPSSSLFDLASPSSSIEGFFLAILLLWSWMRDVVVACTSVACVSLFCCCVMCDVCGCVMLKKKEFVAAARHTRKLLMPHFTLVEKIIVLLLKYNSHTSAIRGHCQECYDYVMLKETR
jgi:hypothetical protein